MRKIFGGLFAAITFTIIGLVLTWSPSVPAGATRSLGDDLARPPMPHSPRIAVRNIRRATAAHVIRAVSSLQVTSVRPGDTLYKIAGRMLGSGSRWPNLWWSNRSLISNPDQIRPGQRLDVWRWQKGPVPAAIEAAAMRATGPAVVTVASVSPAPAATSPPPAALAPPAGGGDFRNYALSLFGQYGWDAGQMGCLNPLWDRESGWNVFASNSSGAYGIPQALPGSKMASAGPDWQTDGDTQIRWGLGYIKGTYGTPCGAWDHELADNWY